MTKIGRNGLVASQNMNRLISTLTPPPESFGSPKVTQAPWKIGPVDLSSHLSGAFPGSPLWRNMQGTPPPKNGLSNPLPATITGEFQTAAVQTLWGTFAEIVVPKNTNIISLPTGLGSSCAGDHICLAGFFIIEDPSTGEINALQIPLPIEMFQFRRFDSIQELPWRNTDIYRTYRHYAEYDDQNPTTSEEAFIAKTLPWLFNSPASVTLRITPENTSKIHFEISSEDSNFKEPAVVLSTRLTNEGDHLLWALNINLSSKEKWQPVQIRTNTENTPLYSAYRATVGNKAVTAILSETNTPLCYLQPNFSNLHFPENPVAIVMGTKQFDNHTETYHALLHTQTYLNVRTLFHGPHSRQVFRPNVQLFHANGTMILYPCELSHNEPYLDRELHEFIKTRTIFTDVFSVRRFQNSGWAEILCYDPSSAWAKEQPMSEIELPKTGLFMISGSRFGTSDTHHICIEIPSTAIQPRRASRRAKYIAD